MLQERQKEILALGREVRDLKDALARDALEKQRLQEKTRELTEVIQTQQAIQRQELQGKAETQERLEHELQLKEKAVLDLQSQLAETKRTVSKLEGTIANLQQQQQQNGASNAKEMEAEWNKRASELKEQYESTMKELRAKLLDYKERLKAEEQKNAQSNNDFGFDEEDQVAVMGRLQLENESLSKQNKLLEAKDQERKEEVDKIQQEYMRVKRSNEANSKESAELKQQLAELKSAYLKLEVANETIKKGGDGAPSDKISAATVKRFEELERKYVQAKRY